MDKNLDFWGKLLYISIIPWLTGYSHSAHRLVYPKGPKNKHYKNKGCTDYG